MEMGEGGAMTMTGGGGHTSKTKQTFRKKTSFKGQGTNIYFGAYCGPCKGL